MKAKDLVRTGLAFEILNVGIYSTRTLQIIN